MLLHMAAGGAWFWSFGTFVIISIFCHTTSSSWPFPVIFIFTASLFLGLIIFNHFFPLFISIHHHTNLPKGSFGWPLLGETLAFLNPHPSTSIGTFLHYHCSRYGKVFRSHLFFSPTVVSCDEELNYFILQNEGKLFQCSYPTQIRGILGDFSMLVTIGDTHRRLRSVALSLVNVTKSKPEFLHDVEMAAIRILKSWVGKQQVLFIEEARKFTFNVIVKQVLGLTPEDPVTTRLLDDFLTFMKGLISLPLYVPGTPYAKAVQARRRISSSVKAIIEERRRRRSKEDGAGKEKVDFLEILMGLDALSEDEKVSFVLDALLGGYETTSVLMAMVVHFLGHSPTALSHIKVINEALRCGNVVKFVHREALKDVKFKDSHIPCMHVSTFLFLSVKLFADGSVYSLIQNAQGDELPFVFFSLLDYFIPSGWKVLPVFTAVHLDSSLHPNAPHFDPWRWETGDQTCKKFTPFGGGSRFCPGSELAKVEVSIFLHHLVQNFRWSSEDSDGPLAFPYVEFEKGLLLNLEHCTSQL
ncbi:Cytochrome P450 724B1 [Linum perenne]